MFQHLRKKLELEELRGETANRRINVSAYRRVRDWAIGGAKRWEEFSLG
jgi:hypothetical protein